MRPTILIVDDEQCIVETLADILAAEGYHTAAAHDGQAALEQIQREPPDAILLDFMMPIMDGLEVVNALRADIRLASIPVVMMTAAPRGLLGAAPVWRALLVKPFDSDALVSTLREVLPAADP